MRPGRSVELVEATLSDAEGEVITASAWRLRTAHVELPPGLASADGPGLIGSSPSTLRPGFAPPGPAEARPGGFPDTGQRRRLPHGDGVPVRERRTSPSPVPRSRGCGCAIRSSPARSPRRFRGCWSPPTRETGSARPSTGLATCSSTSSSRSICTARSVGEWVCLDAITIPEPNGVGVADTALYDERGPIGRAVQALLVDEREEDDVSAAARPSVLVARVLLPAGMDAARGELRGRRGWPRRAARAAAGAGAGRRGDRRRPDGRG